MNENYEALGRYIAAKEQAERFAAEREAILRNVSCIVNRPICPRASDIFAYTFDAAEAQRQLTKASEANQNMLTAVNEANQSARACGKPRLEVSGT